MEWFGPDDAWPAHGRDYMRAALQYARQAGWHFGRLSSHSFGRVFCDRDLPADARCEFLVFSTARGGEDGAKQLRSLVDRCPHKTRAVASRTAVEVANDLLDEADRLVEAAERCMNAQHARARVEELLELAAATSDGADRALDESELLEQAVVVEDEAKEEDVAAASLAEAAGYPAGAPVAAEPLLSAAGELVEDATKRVGSKGDGRARQQVRERISMTRARIEALRRQLS